MLHKRALSWTPFIDSLENNLKYGWLSTVIGIFVNERGWPLLTLWVKVTFFGQHFHMLAETTAVSAAECIIEPTFLWLCSIGRVN